MLKKIVGMCAMISLIADQTFKLFVSRIVYDNKFIPKEIQEKLMNCAGIRILTEDELPLSVKRRLAMKRSAI